MAINKVIYNNETLIDLTAVTVGANNLQQGVTAHDRSGSAIVGTYVTIKPQIIVVTGDGNYLTCSKSGETTLYGIATDGAYAFEVPSYGVWTITATAPNSSLNESTTVNVTSIKQYTVVLNIATTFALADWVDIATYAHNGKAQEIWAVGDTKSYISGGSIHYFEIAGFGDDYIVFDLNDVFQTNSIYYGGSTGGLFNSFSSLYYNSLPDDVKAVTAYVSMPSYNSVFGTNAYPIFATAEGRQKGMRWWLSDYYGVTTSTPRPDQILFRCVSSDGSSSTASQTSALGINYYFNV